MLQIQKFKFRIIIRLTKYKKDKGFYENVFLIKIKKNNPKIII